MGLSNCIGSKRLSNCFGFQEVCKGFMAFAKVTQQYLFLCLLICLMMKRYTLETYMAGMLRSRYYHPRLYYRKLMLWFLSQYSHQGPTALESDRYYTLKLVLQSLFVDILQLIAVDILHSIVFYIHRPNRYQFVLPS